MMMMMMYGLWREIKGIRNNVWLLQEKKKVEWVWEWGVGVVQVTEAGRSRFGGCRVCVASQTLLVGLVSAKRKSTVGGETDILLIVPDAITITVLRLWQFRAPPYYITRVAIGAMGKSPPLAGVRSRGSPSTMPP